MQQALAIALDEVVVVVQLAQGELGLPAQRPIGQRTTVRFKYRPSSREAFKIELANAKLGSLVKGSLKEIKVVQRGVSPRVVKARSLSVSTAGIGRSA